MRAVRRRSTDEPGRDPQSTTGVVIRPSKERVEKLAREIVAAIQRSGTVELLKTRDQVHQATAQALADEMQREEEREGRALARIRQMSDAPRAHSPEWEIVFRRLVDEEYLREGLDG